MQQKIKKPPKDIVSLVKRLNAEGKVKLLIKYVERPDVFYTAIAVIGTEMATDPKLLTEIGIEYKKINKNFVVEQLEECRKNQLAAFQALINFHFRQLKLTLS